mgnify:CR=1 FL=1
MSLTLDQREWKEGIIIFERNAHSSLLTLPPYTYRELQIRVIGYVIHSTGRADCKGGTRDTDVSESI